VQVAEIGVSVENNYGECVLVNRDNVKEAIEKVMGGSEEREKRKS